MFVRSARHCLKIVILMPFRFMENDDDDLNDAANEDDQAS